MISQDRAIDRQQILPGLGLFLVTVLSRMPFRSRVLYHWDSVNLAFGMQEFNIASEQPQPPGYIVYVWLCRLVDNVFNDPQTTMVWIAMVSSGLAVVAIYLLGEAMFNRPTGIGAALLLASSPLFWFYGEIALPHTVDALLVTLSAWGLYQTMQGQRWTLYPTVALLALLGGVRQQSLIFLLPLILFAFRRVGWRHFLAAGSLGVVLCLLWAVPLFNSCGGFGRYLEVFSNYSGRFTATTSILSGAGWQGVRYNVSKLSRYLLYGWGVAVVPPIVYGVTHFARGRRQSKKWERTIFLGLWCTPIILLYAFVHMGQQGMIFTFFPALMVVSAAALASLPANRGSRLHGGTLLLLVAISASIFLFLPQYPLGGNSFKILSWDTLRNNDAYYQGRFDAVRARFSPDRTAIIASSWRHVQWYLPEYELLRFDVGARGGENLCYVTDMGREIPFETLINLDSHLDPAQETALVIFDPELERLNHSDARSTSIPLEGGSELGVLTLGAQERLFCGSDGFGILRDW